MNEQFTEDVAEWQEKSQGFADMLLHLSLAAAGVSVSPPRTQAPLLKGEGEMEEHRAAVWRKGLPHTDKCPRESYYTVCDPGGE